jgi:glycosyltransferase involved in cell wall biosynthesis
MATVEAFVRAFPEPGTARLVIKSINGQRKQNDRERLRYLVSGRPDILLIERYLTRDELDSLMHRADCYVSLHRSEGFGQTLAESMAIGKPVIATDYSGNVEFTRPENSFLVPAGLVPVPPGCDPYLPPAEWGDPDVAAAAEAMRRVMADPEEAARRGAAARRTIESEYSVANLASALSTRLAEIDELIERDEATGGDPPQGGDARASRPGERVSGSDDRSRGSGPGLGWVSRGVRRGRRRRGRS